MDAGRFGIRRSGARRWCPSREATVYSLVVAIAFVRFGTDTMLTADRHARDLDEIARLGIDCLRRVIEPTLAPDDADRFVAIDVNSGAFEVDDDDYAAVTRLHARVPGAEVWSGRISDPVDRLGLR